MDMKSDMTVNPRAALEEAFLAAHGWGQATRAMLAGDASFRKYKRLADGARRAVLMDAAPPREDVRPFVAITRALTDAGFSAPRLLAADLDHGFLLLEDLGDDRYGRVAAADPALETPLYEAAVDALVALHRLSLSPRLSVEPGLSYALPAYDEELYLREAFLFTDWYLPTLLGGPLSASERRAFADLWRAALAPLFAADPVLTLRDYHADNLMWLPARAGVARVGLLDYQDAVIGHRAYDLVSLLEDARRDVSPQLAEAMMKRYLAASGVEEAAFRRAYAVLGAQRNAKIIGIFTRLYARDGKAIYLDLIPRVWGLLERDLAHPSLRALQKWIDDKAPPAVRRAAPKADDIRRLPKRAMVLAAGLGLRMRPLTEHCPKPLIEVAGETMLDRALDHLAAAGVDDAVVNVHHLADMTRRHLARRRDRLPEIVICDETAQLLDSGGGVANALPYLGAPPFFVLNGDMVWRDGGASALVRLSSAFDPARMDALLLVMPTADAIGYEGAGDFFLESDGRLTRRGGQKTAPYVFTGIQILHPRLFDDCRIEPFSLNRIYDRALANGRLYGLVHDGVWAHVGTPDAIAAAAAAIAGR